jgi:membrane protease YdiL (CAAX protease family)
LVLAIALGWVLDTPPLEQIDFGWKSLGWGVAATLPPVIALWWSARSRWKLFQDLKESVVEMLGPLIRGSSIGEFALIAAVAGLGEEALFRGVIQTFVAQATTPWAGLIASSVLFGLAHLISPTYALLAGTFGLYLGWLTMAHGNLLPAVAVHALYDFVALIYLRSQPARAAEESGPAPSGHGSSHAGEVD